MKRIIDGCEGKAKELQRHRYHDPAGRIPSAEQDGLFCAHSRPACRVRSAGQKTESVCIAPINMPNSPAGIGRRSIKTVGQCWRANAVCVQCARKFHHRDTENTEKGRGGELCVFRPARLWRLPAWGEQPPKASRTGPKRKQSNPSPTTQYAKQHSQHWPKVHKNRRPLLADECCLRAVRMRNFAAEAQRAQRREDRVMCFSTCSPLAAASLGWAAAKGEQERGQKRKHQTPRQPLASRVARAMLSPPAGCHRDRWYCRCRYAEPHSRHWPKDP